MSRIIKILAVFGVSVLTAASAAGAGLAPRGSSQPPATPPQIKLQANVRQLMLGILFPASNVVFAAQSNISSIRKSPDAAVSPNPLTSIYGGWTAVDNAAIALYEATNLLLVPGRHCSNGKPEPLGRPDWARYIAVLRSAALASYKAAQSRDPDKMVTVTYQLSQACDACHREYRHETKYGKGSVCIPLAAVAGARATH